MTRFVIVPQWQGSPSARAMGLVDGAEAIAGDLPSSAVVRVEVPLEAGDALGGRVHRLSALTRVRGALDARTEVAARVSRAVDAGRVEPGARGAVNVRDLERDDLIYVCIEDRPRGELIVVTLWEEGEDAEVPKRFTDALRRWPKSS